MMLKYNYDVNCNIFSYFKFIGTKLPEIILLVCRSCKMEIAVCHQSYGQRLIMTEFCVYIDTEKSSTFKILVFLLFISVF